MTVKSKKPSKTIRDVNVRAFSIIAEATCDKPPRRPFALVKSDEAPSSPKSK